MRKRYVLVEAWVPDSQGGGGTPTPPIYYPPVYPVHPIAPGGPPPSVSHPIPPTVWPNPPVGGGGEPPGFWGGVAPPWVDVTPPQPQPTPPGIWGGRPPDYVDIGGPGPQPPPGNVMPPIYYPPGTWGGRPPEYIDIGPPGPQPTPPGIWGGPPNWVDVTPPQPQPGLPTLDPDNLPDHPEVPDLNVGNWAFVEDPDSDTGAITRGFIPWPLAVTHPDYDPNYPDKGLPGKWVLVAAPPTAGPVGLLTWCWIPSVETSAPTPPPEVTHH